MTFEFSNLVFNRMLSDAAEMNALHPAGDSISVLIRARWENSQQSKCLHCRERVVQPQSNLRWVHADGGTIKCWDKSTVATPDPEQIQVGW
jgi:hypothetical protein